MLARKVGQPAPAVSAAEGQNESGPSAESLDLAALRCGRSRPVRHLVESDEAFARQRYWGNPIVLCCADVAEPDVEDLDCPGCRDCVRYCPECAREAVRFSAEVSPAEVSPAVSAAPGGRLEPPR